MLSKCSHCAAYLRLPSLRRYPFTYAVVIVILLLSLLPIGGIQVAKDVPFADKWTHMVMYCALTLTISIEYARRHQLLHKSYFLWGLLHPIFFGGIIELLQSYATTYRSGEWLDLAADAVGCLIGVLLGLCIKYLTPIYNKTCSHVNRS